MDLPCNSGVVVVYIKTCDRFGFMKANNAETPESSNGADIFKWIVTFVLLAAAVVGNYLYGEMSVVCLLYTSPSPRDREKSRMPSSA